VSIYESAGIALVRENRGMMGARFGDKQMWAENTVKVKYT